MRSTRLRLTSPFDQFAGWFAPAMLALLWLALLLSAIAVSSAYVSLVSDHERTIRTADGERWTVSDISAYVRGRLDDADGRRYCELAKDRSPLENGTEDQLFLDQLTKGLCARRLARSW